MQFLGGVGEGGGCACGVRTFFFVLAFTGSAYCYSIQGTVHRGPVSFMGFLSFRSRPGLVLHTDRNVPPRVRESRVESLDAVSTVSILDSGKLEDFGGVRIWSRTRRASPVAGGSQLVPSVWVPSFSVITRYFVMFSSMVGWFPSYRLVPFQKVLFSLHEYFDLRSVTEADTTAWMMDRYISDRDHQNAYRHSWYVC